MKPVAQPDFVIAGAGLIGLSLALELHARGAQVAVLEARQALRQTSFAAAGMLAAEDPQNPAALSPLSRLSVDLYPAYLDRIAELAGERVPFQTSSTLEAVEDEQGDALADPRGVVPQLADDHPPLRLLAEHSIDPRQLGAALRKAVQATAHTAHPIELREQTPVLRLRATQSSVRVEAGGETLEASAFVDCMGTWSPAPVAPRKGQMLSVELPRTLDLTSVLRTREVYIVPRTEGPNAGCAIIGATLEDAGFDLSVHAADVLRLNELALRLLPALGGAVFRDSWAGLRPATADGLPMLGATSGQPRYVVAAGHFRNGILLAPATARIIADLLEGMPPLLDLKPFSPGRAGLTGAIAAMPIAHGRR